MSQVREWIQFIATVISPVILAWVGWVGTEIQSRVKEQRDAQEKTLARQDQLQREAFAASGARFEHTQKIFGDLLSSKAEQKRLAVLATLAFVKEGQIPEFFLPVLAIAESKDGEVASYLRQGLKELTLAENAPPSMRTAATRALSLLILPEDVVILQREGSNEVVRANVQAVTEVAASLETLSATADTTEEKKQAKKQLEQLAPTLAVAQDYAATTARQLATQTSNKVGELQPTLAATDIQPKIDDTLASAVETVKALSEVKDAKAVSLAQQSLTSAANQFKELAVTSTDSTVAYKATDALDILGQTAVQTKSYGVANAVSKSLEDVAHQGKTDQLKQQAWTSKANIDALNAPSTAPSP